MSKAKDFLDFWIENSVHATEQYGIVGASQKIGELLDRCVEMAASEGVTRQDIEAEVGDLDAYLRGKLRVPIRLRPTGEIAVRFGDPEI